MASQAFNDAMFLPRLLSLDHGCPPVTIVNCNRDGGFREVRVCLMIQAAQHKALRLLRYTQLWDQAAHIKRLPPRAPFLLKAA